MEIKKNVLIITPVLNDWESLELLMRLISSLPCLSNYFISVLAVNDGSTVLPSFNPSEFTSSGPIKDIEVLNLATNVGHQRAISVGLAYAHHKKKCDCVVVMDSDGEDRPEDIDRLIQLSESSPGKVVFAERCKRSEGILFVVFYHIYKAIFRLLTGFSISYGNFCLIPSQLLDQLLFISELWSHFASAITRSRIPVTTVPTVRGKRLAGCAKMSFTNLIILGMSAITVSIDKVSVRLIIGFLSISLFSGLAILVVISIKLFTTLAIPGWATFATLGFSILMLQALCISVLLTFLVLTFRTQKQFIPHNDFGQYLRDE